MSRETSHQANSELIQRIDRLFLTTTFASGDAKSWLEDDEDLDAQGKKPLLVWEREVHGRNLEDTEVFLTDSLALLQQKTGEWILERWVYLDTEIGDNDGPCFFLNMYDGQMYYENQEHHDVAVEVFDEKLRIVEE